MTKASSRRSAYSHKWRTRDSARPQASERKKLHKKASQISLDRQLEIPLGFLAALLVCHALSGTSSLSLAHLSAHLPHTIQRLLPAWTRKLPNLAPFTADVPNASHDSKSILLSSAGSTWSHVVGQAGPFRSDAAGFGHPLTALHNFTRACLGLSYALPAPDQQITHSHTSNFFGDSKLKAPEPWAWLVGSPNTLYAKGAKDALYVMTWILIWTALRAACIRYVLVPLGARWVARTRFSSHTHRLRQTKVWERNITRFAERSWSVLFYTFSWSLGLLIAYHSPYWFDTNGLWKDHPHVEVDGIAKFYYLIQCAFWFHQLLVINVEARRKDHWQMFSHHIITIFLIVGSYGTHFTRVGNVILCLMDPSDILLDLAKCLRYVGLQTLCDATFGLFMLTWITTRHVLFSVVIWACLKIVPTSGYERARRPTAIASIAPKPPTTLAEYLANTQISQLILCTLLVALQFLLLLWFAMIVRVAYRVVTGAGAQDTRSDEELSDEDEQELSLVEGAISNGGKDLEKSSDAQLNGVAASASSLPDRPSQLHGNVSLMSSSKATRRAKS